jgi:regulator of replication initiation timing
LQDKYSLQGSLGALKQFQWQLVGERDALKLESERLRKYDSKNFPLEVEQQKRMIEKLEANIKRYEHERYELKSQLQQAKLQVEF